MTLTNTTDKKLMFKIKLNPKQKEDDTPNLRWPVNGFRGTLAAGEVTTVLLAKILPTERVLSEFEKLDVKLAVKQEQAASKDQDQGTGAGAAGPAQPKYAEKVQQVREVMGPDTD